MIKPWKTLGTKFIITNKWYNLRQDHVELPNGRIVDDYFVSVREDVALVVPVTVEGEILLVRQYKHAIGEIVTEVPGGFFNKEIENPEKAALRELQEETGYSTSQPLTKLAKLSDNPTKDTNHLHIFLATNCQIVSKQMLDENEEIEILKVTKKDALKMVLNGIIKTSGTVAALLLMEKIE